MGSYEDTVRTLEVDLGPVVDDYASTIPGCR
jgi:hypothetical protein